MLNRNSVTGETEPECWLYHQANFVLRLVPPGTRIGEDVDFFVLPPVDPDQPTPSIGGGLFASALVDRPEVRAFVEFMASPEWGERLGERCRQRFRLCEPAIRQLGVR